MLTPEQIQAEIDKAEQTVLAIADLKEADVNPRRNKKAAEHLARSIREFGWGAPPIVQKSTMKLIAGHTRLQAAKHLGLSRLPCLVLDVDDRRAKALQLADNRLGEFASWDYAGLKEELEKFDVGDLELMGFDDEYQAAIGMLGEMTEEEKVNELQPDASGYFLAADVVFASANKWGMPDLLPNMLSTIIPEHVFQPDRKPDDKRPVFFPYGAGSLEKVREGDLVCFFVYDSSFEAAWNSPAEFANRLINANIWDVTEPDYSAVRGDALIVACHNLFRSRWMSRFWQEAGINVMPRIHGFAQELWDFNILGIPEHVPVVAVQSHTTTHDKKHKKLFCESINHYFEHRSADHLVIYGGTPSRKWIEPNIKVGDTQVHWTHSYVSARRQHYHKGKKTPAMLKKEREENNG